MYEKQHVTILPGTAVHGSKQFITIFRLSNIEGLEECIMYYIKNNQVQILYSFKCVHYSSSSKNDIKSIICLKIKVSKSKEI